MKPSFLSVQHPNREAQLSSEIPVAGSVVLRLLEAELKCSFSVFDVQVDRWIRRPGSQPKLTNSLQLELCRSVARGGRPEIIAEDQPLVVLAVPLVEEGDCHTVAVATFCTLEGPSPETLQRAMVALELVVDPAVMADYLSSTAWPPHALVQIASLVLAKHQSEIQLAALKSVSSELSAHLSTTFEEICLLFRLTQNLKISSTQEGLALNALQWLAQTLPANLFAVQLVSCDDQGANHSDSLHASRIYSHGELPFAKTRLIDLIEHFSAQAHSGAFVANPPKTLQPDWPFPEIQELVLVPLAGESCIHGWLIIANHSAGEEFGTAQAGLLSSVASILGIHAGNRMLYRQQAELLSGVVRSLTSALDAKDPYTCGHSERVAKISARLAKELGCSTEVQESIYLSGLLHDIGKIGINDQILRKEGGLTPAEYDHIKQHADIGYWILKDLKQLDAVLPVVRHHHEAWDGSGYPLGLAGENIPFVARIVSVADAFDAMRSDRPYRKGMPLEKLESILRAETGKAWDPKVVETYFKIRDEIIAIESDSRDTTESYAYYRSTFQTRLADLPGTSS